MTAHLIHTLLWNGTSELANCFSEEALEATTIKQNVQQSTENKINIFVGESYLHGVKSPPVMLSYCVSNQKESFTFLGIPSNDEVLLKHTFKIKAKLD